MPVAIPTRLKALLHQRHWQTYRTFQSEYDKVAKTIDPRLVGTWPSRAQLHRWMAGELRSLPYAEHCRVLEKMFTGYTAAQLFEPDPSTAEDAERVDHRATEPVFDGRVAASREQWLATRQRLNRHRADLTRAVAQLYPEPIRLGNTGILQAPHWRLTKPIDLSSIGLDWREASPPPVNGHHRETRPLRPLYEPGRQYTRYSRAMRDLDRPVLFENRVAYRLTFVERPVGIDLPVGIDRPAGDTARRQRLTLGNMCYFDMIDVGEALAHETALAATSPDGEIDPARLTWDNLPFRRMIRDPFDLATYPLMLSISTLTVRRSAAGTTFLLLRRSPARVAVAGGMLSVMPTGVFQPASVVPAPDSQDFDLWRNMMREYSEELLGNPEHDGDGPPVDYANTEPFRSMDAARRAGKIRVYCLGLGVDALNYVGDVLTVAVFDADTFDRLFDGMVDHNDEGSIVTTDHHHREFTFDRATIARLLSTEPLAPSGAACLHLAWQHRNTILG